MLFIQDPSIAAILGASAMLLICAFVRAMEQRDLLRRMLSRRSFQFRGRVFIAEPQGMTEAEKEAWVRDLGERRVKLHLPATDLDLPVPPGAKEPRKETGHRGPERNPPPPKGERPDPPPPPPPPPARSVKGDGRVHMLDRIEAVHRAMGHPFDSVREAYTLVADSINARERFVLNLRGLGASPEEAENWALRIEEGDRKVVLQQYVRGHAAVEEVIEVVCENPGAFHLKAARVAVKEGFRSPQRRMALATFYDLLKRPEEE